MIVVANDARNWNTVQSVALADKSKVCFNWSVGNRSFANNEEKDLFNT